MSDLHDRITATIIGQLEQGTPPWQKPWIGENTTPFAIPKNATTGNKYRGINIPLLWIAAEAHEYPLQEWATFKQWQANKESITKGEKGTIIIYYDTFEKEQDNGDIKKVPFIKSSYVFNRCQLVSYNPEIMPLPEPKPLPERITAADIFITNTHAKIEHRPGGASYLPYLDKIQMPPEASFIDTQQSSATENYYSTLLHELTHWSGHKNRCDRKLDTRFGSHAYAFEELIAELSSAFLCAELAVTNVPRPDHASYLASWLTVLKDNKHSIFTAAGEASKAVDYLQSLQQTVQGNGQSLLPPLRLAA